MRPRGRRAVLATAAAALIGLSSCGQTQVRGDRTLELALTEYRLVPNSARVAAGELTIVAFNYGRMSHNLLVSRDGHTAGETQPIWPGASAELTLDLTPGTYLMASTLLSDQALGEYGTLTVTR